MTDQEQNIAVLTVLGWKDLSRQERRGTNDTVAAIRGTSPEGRKNQIPPNHGTNLNACHKMETWLWAQAENDEFGKYSRILEGIVISAWNLNHDEIRSAISAKPAQRREAFLRTLNLYTD